MMNKQQKNESDNKIANYNQEKEGSSCENLYGEEEDEDDLLKEESETNKSSFFSFTKDIQENDEGSNYNNEYTDSIKSKTIIKGDKTLHSDTIKDSFELYKERMQQKKSKGNEEEEESEESEDYINPFDLYLNSNISFTNYFHILKNGDFIFNKINNTYFIFVKRMPFKKNYFIFIKYCSKDDFNRSQSLKKEIIDLFLQKLKGEGEDANIKKEFFKYIKEKVKREQIKIINEKYIKEYSFNKKIKMYYLNYFNKKLTFEIVININWKLKEFID